MFANTLAFSGFAVDDLEQARHSTAPRSASAPLSGTA